MNRNNFGNFNNFNNSNFNRGGASPLAGIKRFFTGKSMLSRLIIINIVVFILVNLVTTFYYLFDLSFAKDPSDISPLAFWTAVPADLHLLLIKPWTVFTYMFLHENLWHLFFNMLILYFGGVIFTEYLGSRKLLITYIFGGLTGAAFYIAAFNIFPAFANYLPLSVALGASASVMAIIVAIATYIPNYNLRLFLIGQVKFKWIAVFYIVIDLLSIQKGNPGGHIAHLGGAFFGFVYILALKRGLIVSQFWAPIKKLFKPKPKMKATYSRKPMTDDEFNYQRKVNQQRIDEILDKIKKSGYESLSKEDKELLFRESKRGK